MTTTATSVAACAGYRSPRMEPSAPDPGRVVMRRCNSSREWRFGEPIRCARLDPRAWWHTREDERASPSARTWKCPKCGGTRYELVEGEFSDLLGRH